MPECANIILDYRTDGRQQYTVVMKQLLFFTAPLMEKATILRGLINGWINDRNPKNIRHVCKATCITTPRRCPLNIVHYNVDFKSFYVRGTVPTCY